jgi:CSLREA domain-containing protein
MRNPRPERSRFALACAVAGATLVCASAASAATIKVNTTLDLVGNDGHCSLREALTAAATNTRSGTKPGECTAGSGADKIVLGADKYVLSRTGLPDDNNATGDLDVTAGVVTIVGATESTTKIDAGGIDRALDVLPGASLTLKKLTITGGAAPPGGRGLDGDPGDSGPASGNGGDSHGGAGGTGGGGGGIRNAGRLALQNVEVVLNHAGAGGNGGRGSIGGGGGSGTTGGNGGSSFGGNAGEGGGGGGLQSTAGSVTIRNSNFILNESGNGGLGGAGFNGGAGGNADLNGGAGNGAGGKGGNCQGGFGGSGGPGGGIDVEGGTVTVTDSTIGQNTTGTGGTSGGCGQGGEGGNGAGSGAGGAGGFTLAGFPGEGGNGGGIGDRGGALTVTDSTISANRAGDGGTAGAIGPGGSGGVGGQTTGGGGGGGFDSASFGGDGGFGGGVSATSTSSGSGTVVLIGVTLRGNAAGDGQNGGDADVGGAGGGNGGGGGGTGGGGFSDGGFGGEGGLGGAVGFQAAFRLSDVTMTGNHAGEGGAGGAGGAGPADSEGGFGGEGGLGGAVFGESFGSLAHVTAVNNAVGVGGAGGAAGTGSPANPGQAEGDGQGGDVFSDSLSDEPPIIGESASILGSCAGTMGDGGGNITLPVLELGQTKCPGLPANPKLGPLANNGGPTKTMALLKGSPAIDRVSVPCGTMPDQRGVPRPQGHGCDSGAYEFAPPRVTTGVATAVSGKSATVAGVIVPNLRKTTWFVEYGHTTAYGKKTPVATLAGSLLADKVKAFLKGLHPNTVVHYRFVATNGDGTARGADHTLKTARAAGVRIQTTHAANAAVADPGERARAATTAAERLGG